MIVVRYQTMGDAVYEDEIGPNIGYDNVRTGLMILPANADFDCFFDPEDTRSVVVIHEQPSLGL